MIAGGITRKQYYLRSGERRNNKSKRSDYLEVGEKYETLELTVSNELNEQFLDALDDHHTRYREIIHPGLFFCFASITQSPSFVLPDEVQAVGAKMEAEYLRPGLIGRTYIIDWEISQVYEKRSRIYQICDVLVKDMDGIEIMRRTLNNTFIGGEHLERRVRWEKENVCNRKTNRPGFASEGYEIVGKAKGITIEKMTLFSGGRMGPNWPLGNIHTDREVSLKSGIGKPVASCLMFESYIAEFMLNLFSENWLNRGKTQMVFTELAGDGDIITPKCVIKSTKLHSSKAEISLGIWCENQDGHLIAIGSGKGILDDIK